MATADAAAAAHTTGPRRVGVRRTELSVADYGKLVDAVYERRDPSGKMRHPTLVVSRLTGDAEDCVTVFTVRPLTDTEHRSLATTAPTVVAAAAAARCGLDGPGLFSELDVTGAITAGWIAQTRDNP